jgi:hypothetical protein
MDPEKIIPDPGSNGSEISQQNTQFKNVNSFFYKKCPLKAYIYAT